MQPTRYQKITQNASTTLIIAPTATKHTCEYFQPTKNHEDCATKRMHACSNTCTVSVSLRPTDHFCLKSAATCAVLGFRASWPSSCSRDRRCLLLASRMSSHILLATWNRWSVRRSVSPCKACILFDWMMWMCVKQNGGRFDLVLHVHITHAVRPCIWYDKPFIKRWGKHESCCTVLCYLMWVCCRAIIVKKGWKTSPMHLERIRYDLYWPSIRNVRFENHRVQSLN